MIRQMCSPDSFSWRRRKMQTKTRTRSIRILTLATTAITLVPALARAADISWNAGSANFNTPSAWQGNVVPGSGDNAIVNNAGTAGLNATNNQSVTSFLLGSTTGSSGNIVQTGGSMTSSGNS